MKNVATKIYYVFLLAGIILIALAVFFAKTNLSDLTVSSEMQAIEPVEIKWLDEDTRAFHFNPKSFDEHNSSLAFYTTHQNVVVYQDGVEIFSLQGEKTIFGSTPGFRWSFVEIDEQAEECVVQMQAVYPQVRESQIRFYRGNATQIFLAIMRSSILEILVSILDLMVGLALIGYWMIASRPMKIGKGQIYLGIFATLMGTWSLNEAEMMTFLVRNRAAASFTGFLLIMLMIIPFTMFVREFLGMEKEKFSLVICILSYIDITVSLFLHMTGFMEFKESIGATHLLMGVALCYLIYALISRYRQHGMDRVERINIGGVLVLTLSFSADLLAYYADARKTDILGKFGFLIYIGLLAWEVSMDSMEKINEGRMASIYKELAEKDLLTQIYNRNAYDEWAQKNSKPTGTAVVTFDLNNLKLCNDTLGHPEGDRYIKKAAEFIFRVFAEASTCFRIGGDEFLVVIPNAKEREIKENLKELEKMQRAFNSTEEPIAMQIAYGYAIFDEHVDNDIEDTRSRADIEMYENKKTLKQQGNAAALEH